MDQKREVWLDGVKTIAIFIVLLNHANVNIYGVNFWGGMFFVPVFFVIAGYTYHTKEKHLDFIRNKAKRLLIPYFVANAFLLCFFAVKELVINGRLVTVNLNTVIGILYGKNQLLCMAENTDFMEIFGKLNVQNIYFMNIKNAPTWFLPALFLSIIIFDCLMRVTKKDQKRIAFFIAILLMLQVNYHYLVPFLLPYSLDSIAYFLVLIQIGYVAKQTKIFAKIMEKKRYRFGALILAILFVISAVINGSVNLSIGEFGDYIMLALYNSVVASLLIMLFCYFLQYYKDGKFLPVKLFGCGKYTLSILCYHLFVFMFFEAGINRISNVSKLEVDSLFVIVLRLFMIVFTMFAFAWVNEMINMKTVKRHS